MARAATNTDKSKNPVVTEVTGRFNVAWTYAKQNHHSRLERNWKLYNNKRVNPSYQGTTNTFVPISFSIVETITSALAAGRPSIDFVPQDMYKYISSYESTGEKPNLKALNAQYDYYWDCDNWDLKSIKTIRGGLREGTSCEWVFWDGDKPRVINLNVRDAIIDPSLTDPMQLITNPGDFFSGRRYITTLDALKAETVIDPETGKLKPRFKNLSQVKPGFIGSEQTAKQVQETFIGATGDTKDLIEVIEMVDGDNIRSVANRTIEIEDTPNELGIHRLVIHRFIADDATVYGKAILDPIAAPQELLNDVTNQSVDAVTDILHPQYELDPMYADHLGAVSEAGAGTVFPFAPGSLKRIDKGTVSPQGFNERTNMKNEMREATGADQIVQGTGPQGGDTTATEIKAQLNQAGQRFELFVRMLEREGFYQRTKIVYKMMLHHLKDVQLVPAMGLDGPQFHKLDITQFDETYEPKIQLAASVNNAKQRDAQQSTEAYQILIADPTNDLWEAKKILYPKMFDLTDEQLDRIIGAEKPQPAAPGLPGGPEAPGEAEPLPAPEPTEAPL